MSNINIGPDFQELTCEDAAAIQGGYAIVYPYANYQGGGMRVTEGLPNYDVGSVKIPQGQEQWYAFTQPGYKGKGYALNPGKGYRNLEGVDIDSMLPAEDL